MTYEDVNAIRDRSCFINEEEDTDLADKDWEVWDDSPAPAAAFPAFLGYELNPSPVREVCVAYFGRFYFGRSSICRSICLWHPVVLGSSAFEPLTTGQGSLDKSPKKRWLNYALQKRISF